MTPRKQALVAHIDFVLEKQFQELRIRKSVGFSFLQAQLQTVK
jgi:hypothetical protein